MKNETKEVLIRLKRKLEFIRKKALPICSDGSHYIDLDYKSWNNPIDGLDYSIAKINNLIKKKER